MFASPIILLSTHWPDRRPELVTGLFLTIGNGNVDLFIDKSIHVLFATFQSQAPDPGLGGLKIWGGVSQFCAVNIGFPTMGASFEQRNDQDWSLMHQDFLSLNIF